MVVQERSIIKVFVCLAKDRNNLTLYTSNETVLCFEQNIS